MPAVASHPRRRTTEQQADPNLSARLLQLIAGAYRNAEERPYIHLVDGGLVDNLGVRSLLDRAVAAGSLSATFGGLPPGSVHKIVLVSVNSERDTTDRIDKSDRVPSTSQVLDSLVFGAGSRLTTETTAMMNDVAQRLSAELQAARGLPGSPFAADAEIHVINVSLHDLQDASLRHAVLRVPTALTILPGQVRELRAAGRMALRESAAFQRLRRSLDASAGRHGARDHIRACGTAEHALTTDASPRSGSRDPSQTQACARRGTPRRGTRAVCREGIRRHADRRDCRPCGHLQRNAVLVLSQQGETARGGHRLTRT